MSKPDSGFDFDRYRKLLAEADDEPKRIALIELLVVEGARAKLAAYRLGVGGPANVGFAQKILRLMVEPELNLWQIGDGLPTTRTVMKVKAF